MLRLCTLACLLVGSLLAVACSASGEGGRRVDVIQGDDGCTPAVIEATPGEKLDLRVKNDTGNSYEIEGIDGAELEEILVPEGRTRSVGYNVPGEGGVSKIKCYIPGGASTIIEVRAGESTGSSSTEVSRDAGDAGASDADATVAVSLLEYSVIPDVASVAAGNIRFEAANDSTSMVHELAVLLVEEDGSLENLGEIEDIAAGERGGVTIELDAGEYQLACLLVPGEAGSTTDHYQEGMVMNFTVE